MKKYKASVIKLIIAATLLLFCAFGVMWAQADPIRTSEIYTPVAKAVSGAWGYLWSFVPFSVTEICLYALIAWFLGYSVYFIIKLVKKPQKDKTALKYVSNIAVIASAVAFVFVYMYGMNYFTKPISKVLSLNVENSSYEELFEAAEYFARKTAEYSTQVKRTDGVADLGTFDEMATAVVDTYKIFGEKYPCFKGIYSKPKYVIASKALNYLGISGIYTPFTAECNVSYLAPDATLPFTMAHEMAHRLGVNPENECNFIAYLSCVTSEDVGVRYSGYYTAYIYCHNAVAGESADGARALWDILTPEAIRDLAYHTEYYKQYEGKTQEVGEAVNNAYLQAWKQESGVKSYGEVVDLLIAEYHQNIKG